jgi:trehalose-phosphatase
VSPAATSSPGRPTSSTGSNAGKEPGFCLDRHDTAVSATYDPSDVTAAHVFQRTDGHHLLLLTDFDGTLSDLVTNPAEARVSPDVATEVAAVARLPRATFGVVSGRRVQDIHERVGKAAAFAAGLHGLEIDGTLTKYRHPALDDVQPIVRSVCEVAQRELAWCAGLFLEDKTYSLTCHVRGVPSDLAQRALDQFVEIAQPHVSSRALKILPAAEALELLPLTDWNKGRAVEWIRDHMTRVVRPISIVYLGDDRTDEDAFAALGDDDVAIGVGERPHEGMIDWRLAGPASVGRFFRHLTRLRKERAKGT